MRRSPPHPKPVPTTTEAEGMSVAAAPRQRLPFWETAHPPTLQICGAAPHAPSSGGGPATGVGGSPSSGRGSGDSRYARAAAPRQRLPFRGAAHPPTRPSDLWGSAPHPVFSEWAPLCAHGGSRRKPPRPPLLGGAADGRSLRRARQPSAGGGGGEPQRRMIMYVARPTAIALPSASRTSTCTNATERPLRSTRPSAVRSEVAALRKVTLRSVVA